MQIKDLIKKITEDFIVLWNNNELENALVFLKEDIVVYSPLIKIIYPENFESKIEGKENLREYWRILISKNLSMKFRLESLHKIEQEVFTISSIEGKNEKLYTKFTYNEYGKIIELHFEYK